MFIGARVGKNCPNQATLRAIEDLHIAAHAPEDLAGDRQPHAQPFVLPRISLADLIEPLKDLFAQFAGNARAGILHFDLGSAMMQE